MPAGRVAGILAAGVGKGGGGGGGGGGGSGGGFGSDDAPVAALFDRRRFREVNSARGRWPFLDDLETVAVEGGEEGEPEEEEKEQEQTAAAAAARPRRRRGGRHRAAASAAPSASSSSPLPLPSLESVASTIASVAAHVSGLPVPASGNLVGGAEQGGLDSLGAVEFARGVTAALRLPAPPLPPTLAFDHPTVDSAARHVHALLVARLQQQGTAAAAAAAAAAVSPAAAVEGEGEEESDDDGDEEGEEEEEAVPLPPLSPPLLPLLRRRSAAAPPPLALAAVSARLPGRHPTTLDSCSVVPLSRWDADARRAHGPARALRHAHWFSSGAAAGAGGDGGGDDFFASFDGAAFGGVSPPEAEALDPQQRLLLQGAAEVISGNGSGGGRGGPPSPSSRRDAAVFVGVQQMEYGALAARCSPSSVGAHSATGTPFSVSAGRVSFTFGLSGPAVAVDTACSSALVGVHLAGQFVRERLAEEEEDKVGGGDDETDVSLSTPSSSPSSSSSPSPPSSIAAGVNLLLSDATTAIAQMAGMLCGDARCKSMDAAADGYGRAEACVVLLLTSFAAGAATPTATGASDPSPRGPSSSPPFALVAATAINQDGRSASLTAPSGPAQAAVMRSALRGVSRSRRAEQQNRAAAATAATTTTATAPASVVALEMHGTGTPLGDPIEVGAAAGVLCCPPGGGAGTSAPAPGPRRLCVSRRPRRGSGTRSPSPAPSASCSPRRPWEGSLSLPVAHLRTPSPHVAAALEAAVAEEGEEDGRGELPFEAALRPPRRVPARRRRRP